MSIPANLKALWLASSVILTPAFGNVVTYDAVYLQFKNQYANWQELEQDPKSGIIYDNQDDYYQFVDPTTDKPCHLRFLSLSAFKSLHNPQIIGKSTRCQLKPVKGQLRTYAKEKLSSDNWQFFQQVFDSDSNMDHYQPVFYAAGAYVVDVWLNTSNDGAIFYKPFSVSYWTDSGVHNLPLFHKRDVNTGCIHNLLVGTTDADTNTWTEVGIKPFANDISINRILTGSAQFSGKNPVPSLCEDA